MKGEKVSSTMKISLRNGILCRLVFLFLLIDSPWISGQSAPTNRTQVSSDPLLEPIGEARLKKVLKENKGHVVILNFWATWCDPCREEFPELIRLYETYRTKKVRLIFLSMDEPDQTDEVKDFPKENRVSFLTYIRSKGDCESLVNSIDTDWIGAIPATFVFDRQGKRVETLVGDQTYEIFEKAVQPLL